jgi:5-(carboxyamino)imidazole ribonucleotide synthase
MPVVGMVGGGQLARMTHQAAIALGQSLRVLAADPADPAALVSPDTLAGGHTDLAALRRFAAGCDVVTFDHEHVPPPHLRALAAEGVTLHPSPDALRFAQDKLAMRRRLAELGVPVPPFVAVPAEPGAALDTVLAFAAEHGGSCVLKARTGGYDGRGVWFTAEPGDGAAADGGDPASPRAAVAGLIGPILARGTELLAEQRVPIVRELAAVVARSPFGQGAAWPVVQTVQRDGICVQVIAPAPGLAERAAQDAQRLALRIAGELGVVGVLAVELFELASGELLVNELAMRPHNSAHWTIEGSATSQFEQHLRAVLDYPLGATHSLAPVAVMANVLGAAKPPTMAADERLHHLFARFPEAKVHLYGKAERPGRKLGHVTVLGPEVAAVRRVARLAADFLAGGVWADGWDSHGGGHSDSGGDLSGGDLSGEDLSGEDREVAG